MKLQQRLQQQLNKSIIIFLIVCLSFFNINDALAANTHSIDLELSSSQYLSIADASQTGLDVGGAFTLKAWVKIESQPGTGTERILMAKDGTANDANRGYTIYYRNTSDIYYIRIFISSVTDISNYDFLGITYTLPTNTWTHIVVTWLGSTKTAKFYINGTQSGGDQTGANVSSIYNNLAPFVIGCRKFNNDAYFDGLIDEVGVWNRILTSDEVAEIYNSGNGLLYENYDAGLLSGLQGYWALNNSLLDETTNNNDLTNNNSAVFSSSVPFVGAERRIIITQ